MTIICTFCNKEYSSYSSRSNHIKKFHPHQNTKITPDPPNQHQKTPQNNIVCNKCNKDFSRQDSLSRHITKNRCKNIINKDDRDIKIEKMEKEMFEYKKVVEKEMNKMKELLQKSLKIHPPVFKENQTDSFGVGKNTSKN